ncbi:MAG: hypothetical protein LIP15_04420 [Clostridium sp.]|nr:hypothetical protein [Clostridium sp.]
MVFIKVRIERQGTVLPTSIFLPIMVKYSYIINPIGTATTSADQQETVVHGAENHGGRSLRGIHRGYSNKKQKISSRKHLLFIFAFRGRLLGCRPICPWEVFRELLEQHGKREEEDRNNIINRQKCIKNN